MPENRPTNEEFSCFLEEHCPKVAKNKPNLWEELEKRRWLDKRHLPIRNWKLYVLGLEEAMKY